MAWPPALATESITRRAWTVASIWRGRLRCVTGAYQYFSYHSGSTMKGIIVFSPLHFIVSTCGRVMAFVTALVSCRAPVASLSPASLAPFGGKPRKSWQVRWTGVKPLRPWRTIQRPAPHGVARSPTRFMPSAMPDEVTLGTHTGSQTLRVTQVCRADQSRSPPRRSGQHPCRPVDPRHAGNSW